MNAERRRQEREAGGDHRIGQASSAVANVTAEAGWLLASSVIMGASVPGAVSLVLGRLLELVPPDAAARRAAWGVATIAFAIGQAGAAYGFSYMFAATDGDYPLLFAIAATALVFALLLDIMSGRRRSSGSGNHSA